MKIVIEAGAEVTLKAGGSFVKVDPSGVTISGPLVRMNSGGGPGSGSLAGAKEPLLPELLTELMVSSDGAQIAETNTRVEAGPAVASVPALKSAAAKDVALLKQCGRQPDGSCSMETCACDGDPA